ncbi:MAG: Cyanophage [Bacteroidota bacterium]|jgi:hypothetical protein
MFLEDLSSPNKRILSKKFVVYLNGKPATYHDNIKDAQGDVYDIQKFNPKVKTEIRQEICYDETIAKSKSFVSENLNENLRKWFQEKWVRFGPDGKIRGDCARDDDSEGKPKCLPQSKAHALGKKGRASAAARKRREDPNPERHGSAINVATKKKTNEEQLDELKCWPGYTRVKGIPAGAPGSCKKKTNETVLENDTDDDKNLKGFHQSLGNAVRGRIAQMQANMAIQKAKDPYTWLWQPGDAILNKKTGKIYKIVGHWMDNRGVAKYFYQGNDEERGSLIAKAAHTDKDLFKLSEANTIRLHSQQQAKDWIEKVYAKYPQTWQNNHVMPLGSAGEDQQFALFELVPSMSKRNAVEIKWFQAYPLKQGIGSRAIEVLQTMAAEDDIALTLFPWNKGQVSQSKLIKFYKKHGFKPIQKGGRSLVWEPIDEAKIYQFPTEKTSGEKQPELVPMDFGGGDEYDILKSLGVHLMEKPDYFEYLDQDGKPITSLDLRKIQKALNRKLSIYTEKQLYGRPINGTSAKLIMQPEDTFILQKDNGRYYLANRAFARTYIRLWAPIVDGVFSNSVSEDSNLVTQYGDKVTTDSNVPIQSGNSIDRPESIEQIIQKQNTPSTNNFFDRYDKLKTSIEQDNIGKHLIRGARYIPGVGQALTGLDIASAASKGDIKPGITHAVNTAISSIPVVGPVYSMANQGVDMYKRLQKGDDVGAAISGLGVGATAGIPGMSSLKAGARLANQGNNAVNKIDKYLTNKERPESIEAILAQKGQTVSENSLIKNTAGVKEDESDFSRKAGLLTATPGARQQARKIVQTQADQNVIQQAKFAGVAPMEEDTDQSSVSLEDLQALLLYSKKENQLNNVKRLQKEINQIRSKMIRESTCPTCGGALVEFSQLNEKKDSCYYKVKSRYKVWPSAYASGALVKCRKKGAKNWGNKSESTNQINEIGPLGQVGMAAAGALGAAALNQALDRRAEQRKKDDLAAQQAQHSADMEKERALTTTPDHAGAAIPKEIDDARKKYFNIPESLSQDVRESFGLRHDSKGWYLREGQENFNKLYLDAIKAFNRL